MCLFLAGLYDWLGEIDLFPTSTVNATLGVSYISSYHPITQNHLSKMLIPKVIYVSKRAKIFIGKLPLVLATSQLHYYLNYDTDIPMWNFTFAWSMNSGYSLLRLHSSAVQNHGRMARIILCCCQHIVVCVSRLTCFLIDDDFDKSFGNINLCYIV